MEQVIKLTKDYEIKTDAGESLRKLTAQELEYTMMTPEGGFYFSDKKVEANLPADAFEYVTKVDVLNKKNGFIGEGLFGEKKEDNKDVEQTPEPTSDSKEKDNTNKSSKLGKKDIIIIGLLGGIFLALIILVIIKIVNSKKKDPFEKAFEDKKEEYHESPSVPVEVEERGAHERKEESEIENTPSDVEPKEEVEELNNEDH